MSGVPPKHYTPEHVKELRKERDMYARTLKNTGVSGSISPRTHQSLAGSHNILPPINNDQQRMGSANHHVTTLQRPSIHGSVQSSSNSLRFSGTGHDGIIRIPANTAASPRRRASLLSYNSGVRHQGANSSVNFSNNVAAPLQFSGILIGGDTQGIGNSASLKVHALQSGDYMNRSKSTASTSSIGFIYELGLLLFRIPKIRPSSSAVLSKVDILDDASFQPVVGNVILQMSCHYTWYGILLFLGYWVNWIGEIRPVTISIYLCVSFLVIQLSRIIYTHNPLSLTPLYISFVPFILFFLLSRESHAQFSVLWFICIMVINMQCGARSLTRHIVLLWVCFLFTYVLGFSLMYECSPLNVFNYDNGSFIREFHFVPIKIEEEGTFIVAMTLILLGLFMLQRYIKQYAYFLIDRQRRMDRLKASNAELRNRLKSMVKVEEQLDLDSPITKVIQVIKSVQLKNKLDAEMVDTLDYVIGILSSNQLFRVDLGAFNTHIDEEVKSWLDNMLQTKETNASPELNTGNPITFSPSTDFRTGSLLPSGNSANQSLSKDSGETETNPGATLETHSLASIPKPICGNNELIQQALSTAESWDFNCFHLAQVTNGRPLYYLAQHIFEKNEFSTLFQFDRVKVDRFLTEIEDSYRQNPYHNSIHGTDVMHGVYYFMTSLGIGDLLSLEERLALILAAACHDVDHPGFSNAFMIESQSDLALLYNDQSVLENYHSTKTFYGLLCDPATNFLTSLPPKTVQHVRQCMVKMILATDMAMHYELHTKFKNKTCGGAGINVKDVKDRQLLLEIAIKCADVSNPARPPHISKKWTELVMTEFYSQGDLERALNMPISRFMDRYNPGVGKCQVGFIEFIVLPLYETWDLFINENGNFPGLMHLSTNREYWKTYQDIPESFVPPALSDIPTPDYLKDALGRPNAITPFPKVFSDMPTVCSTRLPALCANEPDIAAAKVHAKPKPSIKSSMYSTDRKFAK